MTRSHKYNDRHSHEGEMPHIEPKFFAKNGFVDTDPNKIKKEGAGKGNWGQPGAEADDEGFTFAHARRRSNSSTHSRKDFKTKFEIVEREPVFEDMPYEEEEEALDKLEKQTTESSSSDTQSVEEERHN